MDPCRGDVQEGGELFRHLVPRQVPDRQEVVRGPRRRLRQGRRLPSLGRCQTVADP